MDGTSVGFQGVNDKLTPHKHHTEAQILSRHLVELADRVPALQPGQEDPIPYVSVLDPQNVNPYRVNHNKIIELDVTVLPSVQSPPIVFRTRKAIEDLRQQGQQETQPKGPKTTAAERKQPEVSFGGAVKSPSPLSKPTRLCGVDEAGRGGGGGGLVKGHGGSVCQAGESSHHHRTVPAAREQPRKAAAAANPTLLQRQRPLSASVSASYRTLPSPLPASPPPPWESNTQLVPTGRRADFSGSRRLGRTSSVRPKSAGSSREYGLGRGVWRGQKTEPWGFGRSRDGGGDKEAGGEECFHGLQSRLVEAVARSSNFVDDVKRLRRAGGANDRNLAAWGVASAAAGDRSRANQGWATQGGRVRVSTSAARTSRSLTEELGAVAAGDISQPSGRVETLEKGGKQGGRRGKRSRAGQAKPAVEAYITSKSDERWDQPRSAGRGSSPGWKSSPPVLPSKELSIPKRRHDDVERLRRAVQDAIPHPSGGVGVGLGGSGSGSGIGSGSGSGRKFGSDSRTPQWSQKHETCLNDMKQQLREEGSPLLRAKDPAVLVGALLKREGPIITRLDDMVLALAETAEALDVLVSVDSRLRNAGVSADSLFTRAGVVKTGRSLGSATATPSDGYNDNGNSAKRSERTKEATNQQRGGGTTSAGKTAAAAAPEERRRCTVKRVHMEIQRVLGGDVASFKEFKTALSACLRREGDRGDGDQGGRSRRSKGNGSSAIGMEWVTVDELDNALRSCHLTRRALDPQGASHPPLTGKRAAGFLEDMRRSQKPAGTAACSSLGNDGVGVGRGGVSKRDCRGLKTRGERQETLARKRAGKWTKDDRDLAEREAATVIVEQQRMFVAGYVRERRRYLKRRVTAQREGHAGFQAEGTAGGGGVGNGSWGARRPKVTEATKAEFREAVSRTKIVLKLLEAKASASASRIPPAPATVAVVGVGGKKRTNAAVRNPAHREGRQTAKALAAKTETAAERANKPTKTGAAAAGTGDDDGNKRRSMDKVLRMSTEAYSDRVGEYGGGAVRYGAAVSSSAGSSGAAVVGGERGRMNAAAISVQVAYRRRMFHRFVWAQAYLRRPTHAFGIFNRIGRPISRGTTAGIADKTASTPTAGADTEGLRPTRTIPVKGIHEGKYNVGEDQPIINSIASWPEPPGFCPSTLHHVHAADAAFLEYARWCREACAPCAGKSTPDDAAPHASEVGATPLARGEHRIVASTAQHSPTPVVNPAVNSSSSQPPRPSGAEIFQRKHAIRTEAVRSALIDLRVPFMPGGLDAAIEDLERVIATAGEVGSRGLHAFVRSGRRNQGGVKAGRRAPGVGQQGESISFAGWYDWWTRHLPYDPASTVCLLKTVRCAKALHAEEIAAFAGRL